ncbi:prevent-host-death protein [Colwellia sp. 39_35_sub15_T18]|nr:prevent-host-death protein [Colwellia sp. 39_35_sub15_T18]
MNIKPISYMKANAAKLHTELGFEPMHVTQNGNESLVIQTAESYQAQQEKLAFMELILSREINISKDKVSNLDEFLSSI